MRSRLLGVSGPRIELTTAARPCNNCYRDYHAGEATIHQRLARGDFRERPGAYRHRTGDGGKARSPSCCSCGASSPFGSTWPTGSPRSSVWKCGRGERVGERWGPCSRRRSRNRCRPGPKSSSARASVRPVEGPQGQDPDAPLTAGKDGAERIITRIAVLRRQVPGRRRGWCRRADRLPGRNGRPASAGRPGTPGRAGPVERDDRRPKPPSASTRGRRLAEHFDAYLAHLEAAGVTGKHRKESRPLPGPARRRLRVSHAWPTCTGKPWSAGLPLSTGEGMSARTRNAYRDAPSRSATGASKRAGWPSTRSTRSRRPTRKADPRRQRRAMTEAELVRLLDVARRRPLLEALTVRTGQAEGRALRQCSARSAGTAGTARPGTGADLQDAGA